MQLNVSSSLKTKMSGQLDQTQLLSLGKCVKLKHKVQTLCSCLQMSEQLHDHHVSSQTASGEGGCLRKLIDSNHQSLPLYFCQQPKSFWVVSLCAWKIFLTSSQVKSLHV